MFAYEFRNYAEAYAKYPETMFLILNDGQADLQAREVVLDTAWAFNADFLAKLTGIDQTVYECLQRLCEDANTAVLKLIEATCGVDKFVQAAIAADGRGHFISPMDGKEIAVLINGIRHFVYWCD